MKDAKQGSAGRAGLFVTCLVDTLRPKVGFAAVELLESAGYEVVVPSQGCCGQLNYNNGDTRGAAEMALKAARDFAEVDYVVVPSGSCAATIVKHYPEMFPSGSAEHAEVLSLANKTYELTVFLHEIAASAPVEVTPQEDSDSAGGSTLAYHDGCSGLRELGIFHQPRALLESLPGVAVAEGMNPETCCGFGGTFCVRYPEVSANIADKKCAEVIATEADCLVSGDLGCLLNIEGRLNRRGEPVKALHVAEVLAAKKGGSR